MLLELWNERMKKKCKIVLKEKFDYIFPEDLLTTEQQTFFHLFENFLLLKFANLERLNREE